MFFYNLNMVRHYRNSDFWKDTYYRSFPDQLKKARESGDKNVITNTIRKLNNCSWARKLKGDNRIQDIFNDCWNDFLAKKNIKN